MAVGLAVGGWFASAAISKLADQFCSYISDQYEYQKGEKKKLESLQRSLTKIKAVIDAAERRGIEEDANLVSWLNELKDAVYDAEDVVDLFEYKSLQRKAESRGEVHRSTKRAGVIAKRLFFWDDELNELGNVVNKFDKLADDGVIGTFLKVVELHMNTQTQQNDIAEWRQTTPILTEPRVVGRSNEVERLLNLLLVPSDASGSNSEKNFSVVSIVGIGGVGKTTLVQSVYNDTKVKKHFDLMAWVCVSKPYNIRRIMIEILESASINRPHDLHSQLNLGSIQMILNQGLEGNKFLIVLDDIWDMKNTDRERLYSTFRSGKEGSRIVVTTRNQKVAHSFKPEESIDLEGLGVEEFWKFFRCCAFGDVNPEDHPRLEIICNQIAKKLGGLPLAAKTVGGLLQSSMEEKHWRDVLESKSWQYGEEQDGIVPSLKLSYDHLPAHLKQCFVYCSLFPQDYEFDPETLVHYWVALGYIQPSKGKKSLEDVGHEYFTELASRSFFQKGSNWLRRRRYVIHDLLHDMAESISKEEIYRQEDDNLAGLRIPKRVRHLYVNCWSDLVKVIDQVCDKNRIRSLVVNSLNFYEDDRMRMVRLRELEPRFRKLIGLRILIIQYVYPRRTHVVSEWIGDMVHLRYLVLPDGTECPDSCSKLYHLQVLSGHLHSTLHCSESLRRSFNKLSNLRHMQFKSHHGIPSIGHLTFLRELMTPFEVKKEEGYKISELRNLTQLGGSLTINGLENVANKEEAREAELDNKEHLEVLHLYWEESSSRSDEIHKEDEAVLEGLQPHSNLKELTIVGYWGTKTPSWLNKTSNIQRIVLANCDFVVDFTALGDLPCLKFLTFTGNRFLTSVGTEIYGEAREAFPSMEELRLYNMQELTEWSSQGEDRAMMPRLRVLKIGGCPKLKGPIPFHSSLIREFKAGVGWDIDGDMSLITSYILSNRLAYLQSVSIGPLGQVQTFTDEQEWFQSLTSLKELTFTNCNHLRSLPNTIRSLSSLEKLCIDRCGEIKRLPGDGLPPSLKELHIDECWELERQCDWSKQGSEWHKISHIPHIKFDEDVIPRPPAAP